MSILDIDEMVCEINDRPDADGCPQNIIEESHDGRYFTICPYTGWRNYLTEDDIKRMYYK